LLFRCGLVAAEEELVLTIGAPVAELVAVQAVARRQNAGVEM
jgi:hypothetical protein